jgi:hypothetical protein
VDADAKSPVDVALGSSWGGLRKREEVKLHGDEEAGQEGCPEEEEVRRPVEPFEVRSSQGKEVIVVATKKPAKKAAPKKKK